MSALEIQIIAPKVNYLRDFSLFNRGTLARISFPVIESSQGGYFCEHRWQIF
jgi:hypothetical protein